LNVNDAHTDLFDRYLRGELPPGELAAFDRMLADDQDFARSFEIHKILISGIQDHGRQELKDYLKMHTAAETGGNSLWTNGRIWYAAAAVILAFFGVYAVMQFYGKDHPASEIAITEQNAPAFSDTVNMALQEAEPAQKEMSPPVPEGDMAMKEQVFADAAPVPPALQAPVEQEDASRRYEDDDIQVMAEKSEYKVISEKKLMDTLLTIPVLFAFLEPDDKNKKEVFGYNNTRRSAKAKLPSNANNNNNTDFQLNKPATDTLAVTLSGASKKQDSDKSMTRTLKIEYWQSPLNFKGYRYSGDLIQVYGLPSNAVRFYILNNNVYVKSVNTIYAIALCADACPYRIETDQEIINFINRQE
jgi:hypothetical protein